MAVENSEVHIEPITLPAAKSSPTGSMAATGPELSSKETATRWQTSDPFNNIAGSPIPKVARNRGSARGLGPMFS
jgi:hypothetical protein